MDILYYSNYCKHSQKTIQTLVKNDIIDKIYKNLGRDKCWEQYPNGFKSVIDAIQEQSKNPPLTATMTTEDGKEIPVTIKNEEDAPTV